jgi:hypothetical protein
MPNLILTISFFVALFGGGFMALSTDSLSCVALALLFAFACGAAGNRLSLIVSERQVLRALRTYDRSR